MTSARSRGDDDLVLRALILATLVFVGSHAASGQALGVLRIKVVVMDAEGKAVPVPRHALLISDNPATAAPRQIVTAVDGTAEVRLRPGNYTVESDRPVAFQGKAYLWTQFVDIVAGRDAALELTAGNAEVGPITSSTTTSSSSEPALEADPSFLLPQWQNSVVTLWTPIAAASGFVIDDARGLIATSQRLIGGATSIEVQITPAIKVAAVVLASDPARDVAVLRVDPKAVTSLRPVPLGCAPAATPDILKPGQDLYAIGAPLGEPKEMMLGTVRSVQPSAIVSDFRLPSGSVGGPVFTAAGSVVGITSLTDAKDKDVSRLGQFRVVRAAAACDVVAAAETRMANAAPPAGTHLPVEPSRPFPVNALKETASRAGSLSPYQMSSGDFDIAFITPVHISGAQHQSEQARGGNGIARQLMDFSNWTEYVAGVPPVLLIRVTPKLVEGFWTTVARGAARTQGVDVPPIKRVKAGFLRMRAFCGDAEVTPIHPFKLEQRIPGSDAIYEGLYVFDPGALGPHCAAVKLVMFSEKEPEKGDTRVVDPKVLQQIWQDFAPNRAAAGANPARRAVALAKAGLTSQFQGDNDEKRSSAGSRVDITGLLGGLTGITGACPRSELPGISADVGACTDPVH